MRVRGCRHEASVPVHSLNSMAVLLGCSSGGEQIAFTCLHEAVHNRFTSIVWRLLADELLFPGETDSRIPC